jgi:plasmid replication initiation protein
MENATPIVPAKKVSRDEMNLAEFPLAMLSTRGDSKTKTLEFKDTVRGKNGEVLNRHWIITGADKFGLPTASDDEVLLGLLKLTVEEGMEDRKIYFTRYELLRILRWTTEGRSYVRLQKALDRLSGVRIKATNAFYDNENKLYNTRNFGVVDAYEINDGRDGDAKSSFFIWSEVLFKSFQAGFIKKLDLDFYLDLNSAVSKRLYRYLDKHFWYKSRVQINLFVLAHEKIGISRNYKYASSIRQQLDPAFEELIDLGFISHVEYQGRGSGAEISIYAGKSTRRQVSGGTGSTLTSEITVGAKQDDAMASASMIPQKMNSISRSKGKHVLDSIHDGIEATVVEECSRTRLAQDSDARKHQPLPSSGPAATEFDREQIAEALERRGIAVDQVRKLVMGVPPSAEQKVREIIAHYDELRSTGSARISRSPQGFLFSAVKNWQTFVVPPRAKKNASAQVKLPLAPTVIRSQAGKESADNPISPRANMELEYLVARRQEIRHIREVIVERELLTQLTHDVEKALSKIKNQISPTRFREAVEHGVDEKLASLFAIPSFDEWMKGYRGA